MFPVSVLFVLKIDSLRLPSFVFDPYRNVLQKGPTELTWKVHVDFPGFTLPGTKVMTRYDKCYLASQRHRLHFVVILS